MLAGFGATGSVTKELLAYGESGFQRSAFQLNAFPLSDEPFVAAWRDYREAVGQHYSFATLSQFLAGPNVPGVNGAGRRPESLVASGAGDFELTIHPTPAGHIPVLTIRNRCDFEVLVSALANRNEREAIPSSMGATMIAGYPDWYRIRLLREPYEQPGTTNWPAGFSGIPDRRSPYRHRFIVLSAGPYSGIPAEKLGLDCESWERLSLAIRREHECAHYFTKRVFGSMRNTLLDEFISDYCGIASALGRFDSRWLLLFFGLERFPLYREGARLENYRGTPAISDQAFRVLQHLVVKAAEQLQLFDRYRAMRCVAPLCPMTFFVLTAVTIEEMALPTGAARLSENLRRLQDESHAPSI